MNSIIITITLIIFNFPSWGQSNFTPCTQDYIVTVKGKWINRLDNSANITASQKQEAYKRLDILHSYLLKMYPDPTGVDVRVSRGAGNTEFGSTRKYHITDDDRLTFDYVKHLPIKKYYYTANFSPHYCAHTNEGIVFASGSSNENSDGLGLTVNDLAGVVGGFASDDDWLINGLPIRMRNSIIMEKWKGYEIYGDVRLRSRAILIHREGMLPYTPVTRKQYLERCLVVTTNLHDKIISFAEQMPVRSLEEQQKEKNEMLAKIEKDFGNDPRRLKSAVDYYLSGYKTEQQIRDEQVQKSKKMKEQELKRFTDELEKTTREGLLDSPAFIRVMYISDLIFDTDPKTGSMLVTDNPDYIRKELPAHVPQFMVLSWKWSEYPPHLRYKEMFFQDFPMEKLQAMLDK